MEIIGVGGGVVIRWGSSAGKPAHAAQERLDGRFPEGPCGAACDLGAEL